MNEPLHCIYSPDRKRRVVVFRRTGGTFGFAVESWLEPEAAWVPTGRYFESITASAEEAEQQARGRVDWLAEVVSVGGQPLVLDPTAESAQRDLPAFLARPSDAPVYHGFPIIPATWTDGWVYGAITDFEDEAGISSGDGFVVAPNGTRAGIVWEVGSGPLSEILPPDSERWGVYQVWFSAPVRNAADLAAQFREVLPSLQARFRAVYESNDA